MRTLAPAIRFWGFVLISLLITAGIFGLRYARAQSSMVRIGLPQDWSHRHVVFSRPSNLPQLIKFRQDPRFLHQLLRQGAIAVRVRNRALGSVLSEDLPGAEQLKRTPSSPREGVDWSVSLGGTNSVIPRSEYPAMFSFNLNGPPDCANDFAVFPTGLGGSIRQATIVAFNNLYSSQNGAAPVGICGSAGPSVKWAYETPGGPIRTSPVLSLDGTKAAFVSRGTPARLHVLTIGTTGTNGSAVTEPAVPGSGNNATNAQITLNGGASDSSSSVFVDYGSDVGYIGDDAGVLHKITGIFNGTPTEVTNGGWPITVLAGATLTDPVFDLNTKNIFVTGSGHLLYIRDVGSTIGTCAAGTPPCLGFPEIAVSSGSALADSPIVDDSTDRVLSGTAANGGNAQVIQTDNALGNVVRVDVGRADAANPLRDGYFDAHYIDDPDPSMGFYYVCGKATNTSLAPTLYRIGFDAAGVMNPAPDPATFRLASGAAQCSPVTTFFNNAEGRQWIFVGVSSRCIISGGGCILSFDATNGMPTAVNAHVAQRNGTSGIIIDNASTAAQASSIYFTNEGTGVCGDGIATGGCAIKLAQSGLR